MTGRGPSFAELASRFARQRASQLPFRGVGGSGGGGGGRGPNGGPSLTQALGGAGGLVLLVVGGIVVNSSLFNGQWHLLHPIRGLWVSLWSAESLTTIARPRATAALLERIHACCDTVDGGHRAIKYTRLHGVTEEVYAEGTHVAVRFDAPVMLDGSNTPC